jgi:hypothetical protein
MGYHTISPNDIIDEILAMKRISRGQRCESQNGVRAWRFDFRYGGPEVISLIEEDLPAPQPEEVPGEGLGCGR